MASGHTLKAKWVVTSGEGYYLPLLSKHRSRAAAERFARKFGGYVMPAEWYVLTKEGVSQADISRRLAGREYRSVEVRG